MEFYCGSFVGTPIFMETDHEITDIDLLFKIEIFVGKKSSTKLHI